MLMTNVPSVASGPAEKVVVDGVDVEMDEVVSLALDDAPVDDAVLCVTKEEVIEVEEFIEVEAEVEAEVESEVESKTDVGVVVVVVVVVVAVVVIDSVVVVVVVVAGSVIVVVACPGQCLSEFNESFGITYWLL